MCNSNDLKISHFNCNGVSSLLEDLDFISEVSLYDVCVLLETHSQKRITVNGFQTFHLPAIKLPGIKSGRNSGGITILYM